VKPASVSVRCVCGVVGMEVIGCGVAGVGHRIGVGISADGSMAGPSTTGNFSNAVICSPANNTIAQYHFLNVTFAGIVADPSSGTTNMMFTQSNGVTVMTWSREVYKGVYWALDMLD